MLQFYPANVIHPYFMMISIKRLAYPFLFFLGLLLPFIAYTIDEDNRMQVYIQQHSPLIKLPVIYRSKRFGTFRRPNKIYIRYRGKDYSLICSEKYFKNILDSDSVSVHYDLVSDRAVLAYSPITRSCGQLVVITLVGFLLAGKAVVEIQQQLAKK